MTRFDHWESTRMLQRRASVPDADCGFCGDISFASAASPLRGVGTAGNDGDTAHEVAVTWRTMPAPSISYTRANI